MLYEEGIIFTLEVDVVQMLGRTVDVWTEASPVVVVVVVVGLV